MLVVMHYFFSSQLGALDGSFMISWLRLQARNFHMGHIMSDWLYVAIYIILYNLLIEVVDLL